MNYEKNSDGGDDDDSDDNNNTNNSNWWLSMAQELCIEIHKSQEKSLLLPMF